MKGIMTVKVKRIIAVVTVTVALLAATFGGLQQTVSGQLQQDKSYVGDRQDELCLPVFDPADYPHHAYLPLVMSSGGGDNGGLTCSVLEVEPNDTHTEAQFILDCVAGDIKDRYGDWDWFGLNVCDGPVDLTLRLDGAEGTNFSLALYEDPSGWPIVSSEESGSYKAVEAIDLITGTYYALVSSTEGKGNYVLTTRAKKSQ